MPVLSKLVVRGKAVGSFRVWHPNRKTWIGLGTDEVALALSKASEILGLPPASFEVRTEITQLENTENMSFESKPQDEVQKVSIEIERLEARRDQIGMRLRELYFERSGQLVPNTLYQDTFCAACGKHIAYSPRKLCHRCQ